MALVVHVSRGKSRTIIATTVLLAITSLATVSSAATQPSVPKQIRATILTDPTGPAYPTPLPYGTPVVREVGRTVTGTAFVGNVGWAVEWDGPAGNISQYPIRSIDHGATWRTAGAYLAITGAAGANVNSLRAFTSTVVVAYSKGSNVLDVTWDSGRHWYKAWMPGNIISIISTSSPTVSTHSSSSPVSMRVSVRSLEHPAVMYHYGSSTSGRVWRLNRVG